MPGDDEQRGLARRAEYSIARPEPEAAAPDPFSELRDQLATLEEEATRLLYGQRENAQLELSPVRRVFRYVARLRSEAHGLQSELSAAKERIDQFAARLKQLEGIVQSSFARAVKGLSANQPAAQQSADRVVRMVDEHVLASRFLDEHEVPGATLLARVQWLNDKATKTTVAGGEQLFTGVDLGYVKPPRGEVITVVDEPDPPAQGALAKR